MILTYGMRLAGVVVLCSSLAAVAAERTKVDLLVENAKIHTLDERAPSGNAMAVKGGKIAAVGDREDILQRFAPAQVLNVGGATLLPGLTDAHGHITLLAQQGLKAQLAGADSVVEVIRRVKAFADSQSAQSWILGEGWDQNRWEDKKFPSRQQLDRVFADRPVWLDRIDGHAAWANSAALKAAKITRATPDPAGGKILRDEKGEPTGVLVDNAMDLVAKVVPPFSETQMEAGLRQAMTELLSVGITTVHEAGITLRDFERYARFAVRKELKLRVYAMHAGAGESFTPLCKKDRRPLFGDRLTLRAVKIFADGALGSRGAALLDDYSDDPGNRGLLLQTEKELAQAVEQVYRCGYQVAIHAIGDRGTRASLDAIERAARITGRKDLRPRIEHAQVVHSADFVRFKGLGVIASMQPTHATSDMPWAEARLGPSRIKGAYAWRTFLDLGVRIAAGSDFPVERANPFEGLDAAVVRKRWYPEQRMTRLEALRAFTTDAAYAAFQEDKLGSLTAGKWADFIVVDRDPLQVPEAELAAVRVVRTFVAGKPVYSRTVGLARTE